MSKNKKRASISDELRKEIWIYAWWKLDLSHLSFCDYLKFIQCNYCEI